MRWLARQPNFDLAVCVHEDWESVGFYLYELNLSLIHICFPQNICRGRFRRYGALSYSRALRDPIHLAGP